MFCIVNMKLRTGTRCLDSGRQRLITSTYRSRSKLDGIYLYVSCSVHIIQVDKFERTLPIAVSPPICRDGSAETTGSGLIRGYLGTYLYSPLHIKNYSTTLFPPVNIITITTSARATLDNRVLW